MPPLADTILLSSSVSMSSVVYLRAIRTNRAFLLLFVVVLGFVCFAAFCQLQTCGNISMSWARVV